MREIERRRRWICEICNTWSRSAKGEGASRFLPSETGLNSTSRQLVPLSGTSTQTFSSGESESSGRTWTAYVHALSPVSLCPVFRSKSYLVGLDICVQYFVASLPQSISSPVPWTDEYEAAVAFLDLCVRDICPKMRALCLHGIQLLRHILRLCRREVVFRSADFICDSGLRRRKSEENQLVIHSLLRTQRQQVTEVRQEVLQR